MDRTLFEATVRDVETPASDAPAGLGGPRRASVSSKGQGVQPNSSAKNSSRSAGPARFAGAAALPTAGSASESPHSSARGGKDKTKTRLSPEERRLAELRAKFEKTEAVRDRDRKVIAERVDFFKEQREDRFKRLLDELGGRDNLAYTLALEIRQREAHQQNRRRELHAAWEDKVYSPIAAQAHERMNPPNRAQQQRLQGTKSVSFEMPGKSFRLHASVCEDPVRKSLVDTVKENAFHQAATVVLGQSRSAPDLHSLRLPPGQQPPLIPRALSRPVLEPMQWGEVPIKGTIYGHTAQVTQNGTGFHRTIRGGKDAFLPDESDGVLPAGTRRGTDGSYNDKGILRGDVGPRGSTSEFKTFVGSSSGAPAQDHYTYGTGTRITDLEFPPGKRMFAEYH